MTSPPVITLKLCWCDHAAMVANRRHLGALRDGRPPKHGAADEKASPIGLNIEGAGAELAMWLHLGLPPNLPIGNYKDPDIPPDIQVRNGLLDHYSLIHRPDDSLDERFLLWTGKLPTYTFRGWLFGWECRDLGELKNPHNNGPAWFVKQKFLHAPAELDRSKLYGAQWRPDVAPGDVDPSLR